MGLEKLKKQQLIELIKKVQKEKLRARIRVGHFCFICGSFNNITFHHLNKKFGGRTRKSEELKKRGILLFKGEVIPLCRSCHDLIEEYKRMRNIQEEESG